jgi:PmbA protein
MEALQTVIEQVLDRARARGAVADALLRDASVLSLSFESGRLKGSTLSQEAGLNLRIVADGKLGTAGTTDLAAPDDVVARAFASAAEGESVSLDFPSRTPLPAVATFDEGAARTDVAALAALGRAVVEPLTHDGWQVSASVERHLETAWFGNTAGQAFEQRGSAITVSAEVTRVAGDDVLMAYDVVASTGVPDESELAAMVRAIVTKIERSLTIVAPPEGRLPVLFTPQGMSAILMPVNQALSGKSVLQGISPLGGKLGETLFDAQFSLTDDPLAPGRVGSRAADDEGVVSRRLPLIAAGVVRAFVYDLETASRAGARSTGHGQRSTFGKPGISYSNLIIGAGAHDEASLLREVGHGLVVDELIGVGQGNVSSGAFSHPVALAWRVDGGQITGRVKDAAVAGNAFELLKRIKALGRDAKWHNGTRLIPPMVLDGVNVARR